MSERTITLEASARCTASVALNPRDLPDRLVEYRTSGEFDAFYDELYEDAGIGLRELRYLQAGTLIGVIRERFPEGAAVLDVGCGECAFLERVEREAGDRIHGYGIDPSLAEPTPRRRRLGLEELHTLADFPDRFDVITLLDVFEHFEHPGPALQGIRRALSPGGVLIVKVPNKDSVLYRLSRGMHRVAPPLSRRLLRRLYQLRYPPPHYFYYNRASLAAVLEEHGMRVRRTFYESEIPWSVFRSRLWGFRPWQLPFVAAGLALLKLLSFGAQDDCVVVVAEVEATAPTPS